MIADLISDSREEVVHGKVLLKGSAKYKITSCYLNTLLNFNLYDPEKHYVGGYIQWEKKYTKRKTISPPQAISAQTTRPIPVAATKNENEKIMLPPCNCKEKRKNKVGNSDRIKIHRAYWDKNYTERRTWLLKQIDTTSVNRRKT